MFFASFRTFLDILFMMFCRFAYKRGSPTTTARRRRRRPCCGLLAGGDRLHWRSGRKSSSGSCGLLAGGDRLHCAVRMVAHDAVADCLQAGIDYTIGPASPRRGGLRIACRRGSITLMAACGGKNSELRIACRRGSITLDQLAHSHFLMLRIACRRGSITLNTRTSIRPTVADCLQAGIDYTGGHVGLQTE